MSWDEGDRTARDYGEPQVSNGPEMWDDFNDQEIERLMLLEPNDPL